MPSPASTRVFSESSRRGFFPMARIFRLARIVWKWGFLRGNPGLNVVNVLQSSEIN
jgi:hypothetical protein